MYSNLRSCVEIDGYLCEEFNCRIGTQLGCLLSPFLFTFQLNELIHLTEEDSLLSRCLCNEFHQNVTMLKMYADDLIIVGDHIGRVQKLLNTLSEFCNKWGLKVIWLKLNQ